MIRESTATAVMMEERQRAYSETWNLSRGHMQKVTAHLWRVRVAGAVAVRPGARAAGAGGARRVRRLENVHNAPPAMEPSPSDLPCLGGRADEAENDGSCQGGQELSSRARGSGGWRSC